MDLEWKPLPDGLGHVRLAGPRPALRTAEGEFLRLHRVPTAHSRRVERAYLREVAGFVRGQAARLHDTRWPEGRRRILVLGTGPAGRTAAVELARLGAEVQRLPQLCEACDADLVLALDCTPDAAALLAAVPLQGTPVLLGHADGASYLLMPLALDGSEASPDQVRRRRLASSPAADEQQSWTRSRVDVQLPATVRTLAVARAVAIVRSWAEGTLDLADMRRTLHLVHPDLRETRHVVLGFDEPAAMPDDR